MKEDISLFDASFFNLTTEVASVRTHRRFLTKHNELILPEHGPSISTSARIYF